ncbi:ABC transporter permease [Cellulosimicrobium terreum]|nr:ABC transporter permease [Cellulosimicrobium terreum]
MADDIREQELVMGAGPAGVAVPLDPPGATAPVPADGPPSSRRGLRMLLPTVSPKLVVGLVLTLGIIGFAFIAPSFVQDPRYSGNDAFLPPSSDHLLGTTKLGYDVLAQLAYGAKGSLMVGLVAATMAIVLSLVFGIVAGYRGGWTDDVLSLGTNIMLVIPGLPLMMVIAIYAQSRSLWLVALILGITAWPGSAVILRSQARSLRGRDYVAAARVAGEKTFRIVLVEIMPNLLPLLAAQFLGAVILAILGEAGLSFIGLGPNGSITWGTMIIDAYGGNALGGGAWWWFVPPGLMIALFGCGLSLLNFSIDEIINPKLRNAPAAVKNVRRARRRGLGVTAHGRTTRTDGTSDAVTDDEKTKETVDA